VKSSRFFKALVLIVVGMLLFGCSSKSNTASDSGKDAKKSETKADKYPERPIEVIIGYAAGGSTDVIARKVAQGAEKVLGQPLMIVNKPGAAGAVSYKEVHDAKPDGYKLLVAVPSITTHKLLGSLPYDHNEFEPIITFNYEPIVLAVSAKSPWKTLEEFIDYTKKNPGKVKIASVSRGSTANVAVIAMQDKLGIKVDVIEEGSGGAKVMMMAAGGHVDGAAVASGEALPQVKAGNLRVLGIMGAERIPAMPDVPTFKEKGYDLNVPVNRYFLAPKGTPKEIVDKLYKAFKAAVDDPSYAAFLKDYGAMPLGLNPEETKKYLDADQKFYEEIFTKTGDIKK
jgi:tripartite-type tricarboxylate transporter receptor subunit TctC